MFDLKYKKLKKQIFKIEFRSYLSLYLQNFNVSSKATQFISHKIITYIRFLSRLSKHIYKLLEEL
jgi:hypothetical protein